MIIDSSRGEIQLDDLFEAIEHDQDQVTQALDLYGDYLKVKNETSVSGEDKIELLERILKLECIEQTTPSNNNNDNERSRINLKWTTLTECGIWCRKLGAFQRAIECFEKANTISDRVSTIYYEMGMCHLELGNVYQVKTCFEKTIAIGRDHFHWTCLEQLICLYFILGNFLKCLEYIRIGFDRVATFYSTYDTGQACLILIERNQPSMKMLIEDVFKQERERQQTNTEYWTTIVNEFEIKLEQFKEKLLRKKNNSTEPDRRTSLTEQISIENFQDFGQYLVKKTREYAGDSSKLCKSVDVKKFLPVNENLVSSVNQKSIDQQANVVSVVSTEEQQQQSSSQRKKRSGLPLNLDDYEKRRSARSITRVIADDQSSINASTVDKLRHILCNQENSSDEEDDETLISPDNNDDGITPSILSEASQDTFPALQIEFKSFIESINRKITAGRHCHYIDLVGDFIDELTKHSSTLWPNEMRNIFAKLFDWLLDHVQYSTTEIQPNHLLACLCYVENALGSAKLDFAEDSIERFSCFARLKTKFKSLGYCFARLQFYLYLYKNSSIQQQQPFDTDEVILRILWISSLYDFLSGARDDALACVRKLQHVLLDTVTITLPNLNSHASISKTTAETLLTQLTSETDTPSNSSSSQELTYILSRIVVAEENDELASLAKKLKKKIDLFYAHLSSELHVQQQSLVKCYETLVNVLNENQHLNESENVNVRLVFDQIFVRIIDMLFKLLDRDTQWEDASLKSLQKSTMILIDSIMKRDPQQNVWPFDSINPWLLLHRVTIKQDPKRNERCLVSFVRTVHGVFGRHGMCLIQNGALLEYFLLELIQIEHPNIKTYLFSNTITDEISTLATNSNEPMEQKSKLSKVIDEAEQCIYCLYGLVLRKSKMKNLIDHDCRPLELTLDKASIVFYALRPKQLPGYEGRTCTITNETESLFQRFESMIEWNDEREERRKLLLSYIADTASIDRRLKPVEELMHLSDQPFRTNNTLFEKDLYYLFADYYLKMGSKDAAGSDSSKKKAQEYYMKDLCLNCRRFDSWAGLTVIEFYKIEEFVEKDDFDARIFNVHMSASSFFRQAVAIESNNHTLWMEYAEITYILHAYCSKYKDKSSEYVQDRSCLLHMCQEAYEKAHLCTDNDEHKEDWTYLYMLAKIDEKLRSKQLFNYLKKYVGALDLLHENKALYPRKLGHHTATSSSKGTLLGCHAVEMFYRIHGTTLKYLNRHSRESIDIGVDLLNELLEFLNDMQSKPFATSFYDKSNIPTDARAAQLINDLYFPNKQNPIDDPWLTVYHKCVSLCIEGLYICIARYNRHYRGLYRLAHFFHTNEHYRNHRLSLEFLLGGRALELKNYPKIIGLFQERSKHNLFNGIWRIQPLDAERAGSFNSSMYKSTRLLIELLAGSNEQLSLLVEVIRQLLDKPEFEKKYLREVERKLVCHQAIKSLVRTIKKKILLQTREDIEREGLTTAGLSPGELNENGTSLPILFEMAINLYNLIKNYTNFFHHSHVDELVELIFQRYRTILKNAQLLPENAKADSLVAIYTPKKIKPVKKRSIVSELPPPVKRPCVEEIPSQENPTTVDFQGLASFISID